ncbi:MAG TPA: MerR family transcriptional regulator [Candidatus Acidoferrales bacterium]|nr:MerR family transcriptional regulator [Candidatus Acidoferrales bacterium]
MAAQSLKLRNPKKSLDSDVTSESILLAEAILKPRTRTSYRVHEFAATAGVTVRALHHYDRLGLLKAAHRSESGYRLYSDSDLARLEQIVVLKFLGLPLKQIRELLKDKSDLPGKLRRQQQVLVEKRRQLDRAIQAIRKAEKSLQSKREPDWKIFRRILKEIEMQNNTDWTQKYYSEAAQAKIEERKASWSPELQAQVSKDWAQLFADIEASLNEDPASPKAQALAARWKKLVHGFTGGDPEVQKGLNAMYADRANWPTEPKKNWQIRPEIQAFICNAMKVGGTS